MKRAGELIEKWLKESGYFKSYQYRKLIVNWSELVGEKVASSAVAVKVEGGVLWVKVKSSVWLHHLSLLKREILCKVNKSMGNNKIKDIYFYLGDISCKKACRHISAHNQYSAPQNVSAQGEGEQKVENRDIEEWVSAIPERHSEIKQKIKSILNKKYNS